MSVSNTFFVKVFCALLLFGVYSCGDSGRAEEAARAKEDSIKNSGKKEVFPEWIESEASAEKGVTGIFEVPEMLALCKYDSAYMKDVSAHIIKNFEILENDLKEIDSEIDQSQGLIYYNNNPENFKFECFMLLKKMPVKKPRHSQIVVLESGPMLIYNYYGPYSDSFKAYEEIKRYCKEKHLVQTGLLREYYMLSQVNETDPGKLLTRIMVPVIREKQSEKN